MKETNMLNQWRTIQFFLGNEGVSEVKVDIMDPNLVQCSCPSRLKNCKHISYVRKVMKENDGNYSIQVPEEVDEELADEIVTDVNAFREFIMKYGEVVVID